MSLEDFLALVKSTPSWSCRIEAGHQATQITVFDGVRHHSLIARLGESDLELFERVLENAKNA